MRRCVILGVVLTIGLGTIRLRADGKGSGKPNVQAPATADWPAWRGPNRNGISSEVGWRTDWNKVNPPVLWQAKLGANVPKNQGAGVNRWQTSICSVANGRLFIYSDDPRENGAKVRDFTLLCLDAMTGKELWRHAVASTALSIRLFIQAPVVDGDSVYMYSPDGMLERLKIADGAVIWSNDLRKTIWARPILKKDGIRSSPLIVNGLVMAPVRCRPNRKDADVIAVRVTDGSLVWASGQPSARLAHGACNWQTLTLATINGKTQVIYLAGSKVVGISIADGATLWEFQIAKKDILVNAEKDITDIAVAASPVVDGNAVTFSYTRGHKPGKTFCIELDAADKPRIRWKNDDLKPWKHSFILYEGYLYGPSQKFLLETDGATVCIDPKTGKIVWQGDLACEMILADGKLIVWDGQRLHLVKASPKAFEEIAVTKPMPATGKVQPRWSASYPPVLSNGLIYCRNEIGDLFCVDVRQPRGPGRK